MTQQIKKQTQKSQKLKTANPYLDKTIRRPLSRSSVWEQPHTSPKTVSPRASRTHLTSHSQPESPPEPPRASQTSLEPQRAPQSSPDPPNRHTLCIFIL